MKAERKYHVFVVMSDARGKATGKFRQLTGYSMTHEQSMTFISKQTHPASCFVVDESHLEKFRGENTIYEGWQL